MSYRRGKFVHLITSRLPHPVTVSFGAPLPATLSAKAAAARKASHKTAAAVTEDLARFHFNKAVARIRELANTLADLGAGDGESWALREGLEVLVGLINPITPHLAEELWQQLGHADPLTDRPWPTFDPALAADDVVTVAVQVNGKLRATLSLAKDLPAPEAEKAALADPGVVRALDGKAVRKVIVVPNRIVNIVA